MNLGNWFDKIWADEFRRYLLIVLVILGIFILFSGSGGNVLDYGGNELVVHFFSSPTCPHCAEQKKFNVGLEERYPEVKWIEHDVTTVSGSSDFKKFADRYDLPLDSLAVPTTFFGGEKFIGFADAETTGVQIENALKKYISGGLNGGLVIGEDTLKGTSTLKGTPKEGARTSKEASKTDFDGKINVSILGDINVLDYSLVSLAVVLGLLDGFNPCAMWVLVYLITLIISLNDRKKIWLLVGSFVFASGVLYFLFMTAWLNVFLLIGYLKPLILIVGLGALFVGINDLKVYFMTKGAIVCEVGDVNSKKRTMSRMQKIVESPLTRMTVFAVIGLAFVVNSIEFACSAVVPVVFTQVLTLSGLSGFSYYGYILLYVFFFMLDDLIIFSLAAFAVTGTFGQKYAKLSKLVGGVILVVLGLVLVFKPELLSGFG